MSHASRSRDSVAGRRVFFGGDGVAEAVVDGDVVVRVLVDVVVGRVSGFGVDGNKVPEVADTGAGGRAEWLSGFVLPGSGGAGNGSDESWYEEKTEMHFGKFDDLTRVVDTLLRLGRYRSGFEIDFEREKFAVIWVEKL
jgi:hypothetical protein